MTANHKVDWRKTCSNISSRLSGLAWAKDVAPVFHLSIREAQHKLTGQELSVEELSLYASLFGCSIDDLLVFDMIALWNQNIVMFPSARKWNYRQL